MLLSQLDESSIDELISLAKDSKMEQLEYKLLEIKNVVTILLSKTDIMSKKSRLKLIFKTKLELEEIKKRIIMLRNMLNSDYQSNSIATEVFELAKMIKKFRENNIAIIKEFNKLIAESAQDKQ
jgi:hypothetical protein